MALEQGWISCCLTLPCKRDTLPNPLCRDTKYILKHHISVGVTLGIEVVPAKVLLRKQKDRSALVAEQHLHRMRCTYA